jgi:hypothetical protein
MVTADRLDRASTQRPSTSQRKSSAIKSGMAA